MNEEQDFEQVAQQVRPGCRLLSVRRLTGGVSADVHALMLALPGGGTENIVLRQHRVKDWKRRQANVTQMEYQVLAALHRAGMPVPEPLHLDDSGSLPDGPYLVTSFMPGSTDVPPEALDSALDHMAGLLARLHSLPADLLSGLPMRADPLPELFEYLPDTPLCNRLRELLTARGDTAYQEGMSILHGDFWPGNILWVEGAPSAILDWEDAALGDPACDVAGCRLEVLWKYGPEASAKFADCYAILRSLDPVRLALWEVFVASAGRHFLGEWGLEPDREAEMRGRADKFIHDAATYLIAQFQTA
ncbi:MAG: phosphotransferase [Pseudomonadales bacterium]